MDIRAEGGERHRSHEEWRIEDVLVRFGMSDHGRSNGGWIAVRCPFHPDRHRSAGYSRAHNGFRCMACGAAGNPITLVMQQRGCSMVEAVRWLDEGTTVQPRQATRDEGDWWRNL